MERLRTLCLIVTLLASASAFAHDPLPLNWGTRPDYRLVEIGVFEIDIPELLKALADEQIRAANCAEQGIEYGLDAAPPQGDEGAYWQYPQPLFSCGVVLKHLDWNAATRLARRKCEDISQDKGIWPPAIPFVSAPATYNDQNASHHEVYEIMQGKLIGACVADIPNPQTP